MRKQFSMETVDRAEQLYCGGEHTLREVGALTGVSLRTLKRWNSKYGWAEKRVETRRTLQGIRIKTVQLREKLIENCIQTLSARDVLAVASMESIVRKAARDDAKRLPDPAPDALSKVSSEEESIAALEKACRIRMNQFLTDPAQLNVAAIRGLDEAMRMVRRLKIDLRRNGENNSSLGLVEEAEAEIRRKFLGLIG